MDASKIAERPCKDKTDMFFPTRQTKPSISRQAMAMCEACPIRWACLQKSKGEAFGIWAGMSNKNVKKYHRMVAKGHEPTVVLMKILKRKVTWVESNNARVDNAS